MLVSRVLFLEALILTAHGAFDRTVAQTHLLKVVGMVTLRLHAHLQMMVKLDEKALQLFRLFFVDERRHAIRQARA